MTILERLRKFDAYPKTLEEYRDKTIGGAAGFLKIFNCLFFWRVEYFFNEFSVSIIFSDGN